ncbi:MAG: hypothetical protein BM549_00540 [Lacinutrix sp. MedPE-SW]|nr:MAG: hypothetical protein BM549_00540 [Lacinutrix sp. MedPE-SW]
MIFNANNSVNKSTETTNEISELLTFDGFEGGHYFFTNTQNQAMSFDYILKDTNYTKGLKNGKHLGETFKVTYIKVKSHNFNNTIKDLELYN